MPKSESKTSSETNNTVRQSDDRVTATEGAVAIGSGATVSIDARDPEAFELAESVVGILGSGAGAVVDRVFDVLDTNQTFLADVIERQTQSEDQSTVQRVIKLGGAALAVVAVIAVASRMGKS